MSRFPAMIGAVGGKLPTAAELQEQIANAIGQNLALGQLAPRPVLFNRTDPAADARREALKGRNPFLASADPLVGESGAGPGPLEPRGRCCLPPCRTKFKCTTVNTSIGSANVQLVGINHQRISISFAIVGSNPVLINPTQIDYPMGSGMFRLSPNEYEILKREDFGDFICGEWWSLTLGIGGYTVQITEILER